MNLILITYILVPLLAAVLMMPLKRLNKEISGWLAVAVTFGLFVQTIALYFVRPFNFVILYYPLTLDGLSHLILLVMTLATFVVSFYAVQYMRKYGSGTEKYYTLYMLLLTGMCGVALAGDLVSLFIFMEVAALSTYALVAFGQGPEEIEAAIKYLVMGAVASLFILIGISLVYGLTGTFALAQIARTLPPGAVYAKGFITALFLAGFGMKAALMPFHAWLPDAHTSAPAPVSATLSGVLIKVLGLYVMVRLFFNVLGMTPQLSYLLTFLGAVTLLAGDLMVLTQNDFKRLLAYSSIGQIGYMVIGFSLGTPLGLMGALFHLFNHAIFKPLLFMNAGAVEMAAGTRQLDKLGGLGRRMPLTAFTNLVGSLSISGLPPFNGFWSKLFIIVACVQAGRFWTAAAAVLGAIITLANFTRLYKMGFTGRLPDSLHKVKESPWMMSAAVCFMALLCLLAGLAFPLIVSFIINPAVVALANGVNYGRMIAGVR